ncbi:hypothetical protein LC092_14085 [Stappia stellulata]|uniref:hypothetical protein n=1 Tax=Stappia stellulata TaxID=71235 RepID=UPI001CD33761|nr:hypothetical protein [Stappia stellulata]MCA1243576.1 hypothetical protein [Stappia stellulata]
MLAESNGAICRDLQTLNAIIEAASSEIRIFAGGTSVRTVGVIFAKEQNNAIVAAADIACGRAASNWAQASLANVA